MDAGSLDAAVQGALQALYPPFEATAPTVLGQVFRLLETTYQGDGLYCLLQFLIPAKRLFEHVRQAACAPYFNCIFLHEGWPLCLHEKVVVHLAPLNPLLLRPGDFYLQAELCEEHTVRITLKHLSCDLRTVEETPVPEAAYSLLFTNEWLEGINSDRSSTPLCTCLVATENGVTPLPWSRIATPQFIAKPKAGADSPESPNVAEPHGTDRPVPYSNVVGTIPGCRGNSWEQSQGRYPGLIKVDQAGLRKKPPMLALPSLGEVISQDLEGEYVDLMQGPQEQVDLLAQSLPPEHQRQLMKSGTEATLPVANEGLGADTWPCGETLSSEKSPCVPCLGTKPNRELGPHGLRCRHRDSYMAALQNPVNLGPGLMAAILEEPAGHEPLPAAPCETHTQYKKGAGSPTLLTRHPCHEGPGLQVEALVRQGTPMLALGSGHKFSFLKGPRLRVASGDERASSQFEGAWKKMSAIYSPRMGRARPAGKGVGVAATAPAQERSLEMSSCKNGPSLPSTSTTGRELPAWQKLHVGLLHSGIMCLPGKGKEELPGTLSCFLAQGSQAALRPHRDGCPVSCTCWFGHIPYIHPVPTATVWCLCQRQEARDGGLTIVVDARKQPPAPNLFSALHDVQSISPGCIRTVLLLAEKELVVYRERLPRVQVEMLASLKALGRYVDRSQLTPELDGTFPYCHSEWVQFFQKLHPFMAGLQRASELLQTCIEELRGADALVGSQDAATSIRRHQELMQKVLSDLQLVQVQREGGAVLARLRRDASRLHTSANVRASMELAEGLYSRLEEQLHDLVSQSNSSLEHLEFLQKIQQLEAKFKQLGHWLDGEAATRLQEMGTEEWSPNSPQGCTKQFNEFLVQAMARYQQGLALCREAAEIQDAAFPEADTFQAATALFQTKLMGFSRQVERRRAEQELRQELGHFSSKMAGLKLERRQCVRRGEDQALQSLQSSFQKLSAELALEKLQEMEAQVRKMQSSRGLAAWAEVWHQYQEMRRILEEMLAELQEAWGAQAEGEGGSLSPSGSGAAASCKEAPVCKVTTRLKPVVSGEWGFTGQLEPSIRGHGEPCEPGQPQAGLTMGAEPSYPEPSDCAPHHHDSAGSILPKPKSGSCSGAAGRISPELSQPLQRLPLSLPRWACGVAGADPSCPTAVPHGTVPSTPGPPVEKQAEATQYFQVSSQSSFSSEDSDSQVSTKAAPAVSAALPWNLLSPKSLCPFEKAPDIIYLENHRTDSPAKANAK